MTFRQHIYFWLITLAALTIIFGIGDGNYILSFYFVCLLLPVAIGTSWFFNEILVRKYLVDGKVWLFVLYLLYLLIISLWLQMLVILGALVLIGEYNYQNLNPMFRDVKVLAVIIYLIVFIQAFITMFRNFSLASASAAGLKQQQALAERGHIIMRVDRKNRRVYFDEILYAESRADYIEVHLINESFTTREKISQLEQRLPADFIRIHRSFLVNREKVTSFNREEVVIGEKRLPVGRKYKDNLDDLAPVNQEL